MTMKETGCYVSWSTDGRPIKTGQSFGRDSVWFSSEAKADQTIAEWEDLQIRVSRVVFDNDKDDRISKIYWSRARERFITYGEPEKGSPLAKAVDEYLR